MSETPDAVREYEDASRDTKRHMHGWVPIPIADAALAALAKQVEELSGKYEREMNESLMYMKEAAAAQARCAELTEWLAKANETARADRGLLSRRLADAEADLNELAMLKNAAEAENAALRAEMAEQDWLAEFAAGWLEVVAALWEDRVAALRAEVERLTVIVHGLTDDEPSFIESPFPEAPHA